MTLESLAAAYGLISGLGFPFMLFLVVVGSFYEFFYWGRSVRTERDTCAAREAKLEAVVAKIEAAAAVREKAQQERIDELFDKMIEAAGLIRESARQVSR